MDKIKLAIAGILLSVVSYLVGSVNIPQNLSGMIQPSQFPIMATSSAITVGEASTLIQATTTRQYMVIVNDGSNVVYLALNGDKAAIANSGIRLNASGGSYEITPADGNQYSGAIRAIAVGGTSVVTVSGY